MHAPAPQQQIPTFPCTACGQPLPGTVPKGMKFPCYHCGAEVVSQGGWTADQAAEYQAWAMQHGATEAALQDQQYRQQNAPGAAHFASSAELVVAKLGGGELIAIGPQVAADGTWMLKAVDLRTQQTRWEALQGTQWSWPPGHSQMAMRSDRIYLAHEGILTAVRLIDGAKLWSAFLTGPIERDCDLLDHPDEIMLFEVNDAVVFVTEQGNVMALDRNYGKLLWQQQYDDSAKVHPVPGFGVLVRASSVLSVLHALPNGEVVGSWSTETTPSYDDVVVAGGVLVAHVTRHRPGRGRRRRGGH